MLHPLEHVRDHQNPLADPPALASRQAPQLGRPRFAAKKVCRHHPSPKHGPLASSLYHIWRSPEAGIRRLAPISEEGTQQFGGATLLDAAINLGPMMGRRLVEQAK